MDLCQSRRNLFRTSDGDARKAARGKNTRNYNLLGGCKVILADQVLELRVRKGQLVLLRRPKILDFENKPPSMMDAIGWEEV